MGELRGRAAAPSEPALVFAGRALFPLPKQLFRLYTHLLRYLLKSEAFLSRASGTPARFHTEKRAYETEFGELTASTVAVVCGKVRLPRVGAAVFVALASKQSPEDWAHALVFRSDEKTEKLYAHLKEFHSANPTRFLPDRFIPHPVTKEAAMAEYRCCFPVTVFDMEMNYERPIQFAGRRLVLLPDGTVEEETLSLYVRQKPKLSRYVAELTHLTDSFLRQNGIPEQEAAEQIYAFLTKGGCFAGNALHNDLISLRAMFRRCGFPQEVLRRDIVDLTMAVRFDMGVANEPSLRLCMEHAGLAFSEDKFHDASYDTEGAARLFLHYIPGFIVKYGKAPLAPWDFFEPMREKEELDALYAETYIRPPKAEKKTGEGKSGDDPDGSA
ncbi:MAG: 3'-5' exonuclease [Schwartzia sp.]|nr:3'-5' exonuclease [Schwartzia sp. (in: firmicutes)]